jgi:16S rRNA (adenine1518-N6/adenine1519-N6)-dimethyltransferase
MMNLCDLRQIKPLLARHGFHFSKSMGQNFLIDASIPMNIAEASEADEGNVVLEIGPGIGPLTVQLSKRAEKVVSVELDQRLLPVLAETLADSPNVTIVPGDIMKLDLNQLAEEHFGRLTPIACANLPYNITTPVLTKLVDSGLFRSITVMIQREVAQRICARPGTADYGAFSLYCQYHADCSLLFEVPPECFLPAPKVTSAVVRMVIREQPPVQVVREEILFRTIRASFIQRRKKLLNGLTSAFAPKVSKDQLRQALSDCGFDENVRGEQLSLEEFAALSNEIAGLL